MAEWAEDAPYTPTWELWDAAQLYNGYLGECLAKEGAHLSLSAAVEHLSKLDVIVAELRSRLGR